MPQARRFLVKMRGAPVAGAVGVAGLRVRFAATPLFSSIPARSSLGLDAPASWHILEPEPGFGDEHPWDICHSLASEGLAAGGGQAVEFAEPDFEQHWLQDRVEQRALAMTAPCEAAPQDLGPDGFPGDPANPWWYQDPAHGQFAAALAQLGDLAGQAPVRIAHLDTGYDPRHLSLPQGLERELQRNFVDPDRPRDATDLSTGIFNNLGHGTGTLSILAGAARAPFTHAGAAPFAKVVPVRVADRVEVFRNSAIAQAFDYVHALCADEASAVQVLSMSLGGLASQAWAEAVNALYEAGVVLVAAAGNNYGNLPTRNIVFPARFRRVIAACGVMANGAPYANLPLAHMAGNYGPASKMRTALSAWTPNVPWAKWGCAEVMNFDGRGTSAATPQVAAAAAIWLQLHKAECDLLPARWMRVEAVRQALFGSAGMAADGGRPDPELGMGQLRARDALQARPDPASLVREEADSASFALLRVLTGFGIAGPGTAQQRMLELEALQLSQSAAIEALLPDPGRDPQSVSTVERMRIAEALAADPRASRTLRSALQPRSVPPPAPPPAPVNKIGQQHLKSAVAPRAPEPLERRIRVYAYDPSLGRSLETAGINQATLMVPWESDLRPGPVGEYVEVVDVDPASGCCYAPVDLNDHRLIATDGLAPSETNPQFHQQMAYAVSMTTIGHFERALGRVALWSSMLDQSEPTPAAGRQRRRRAERYVQRLRIYPHALRDQNAYYSPARKALLLGYFSSRSTGGAPSELVFAALSHDIVAHETTHALLDGLHRRFREPTNRDVLAFHEAFADIVALFQHFSLAESLREEVARAGGDLARENLLGKLAVQFGEATGHYGALRDYIGTIETDTATGERSWKPLKPSREQYASCSEPHELGAVLVAAVFDAFLKMYRRRAQEPILLATGGSGVLPPGALPAGLADALTKVASKVAAHVLVMCIRALDYCPPIDITFGDYLRALVTADRELVPKDRYGYRVAFVSSFAERGIFPREVRSLSVETILWEPPPMPFAHLPDVLPRLDLRWDLRSGRRKAWNSARSNAVIFRNWLLDPAMVDADELDTLGLRRSPASSFALASASGETIECAVHGIEVHSVRPARRVGPDGQLLSQAVVEITQGYYPVAAPDEVYRAGVTLVIDLQRQEVVYLVRKRADLPARISEQQQVRAAWQEQSAQRFSGTDAQAEPFRFLHQSCPRRTHASRAV